MSEGHDETTRVNAAARANVERCAAISYAEDLEWRCVLRDGHTADHAFNETTPVFGRCRRHAPTMSGFPAVYGTDFCGDHKLDEAKA